MKKLLTYFRTDKEIWLVRLYFILCIAIAIVICYYWGNAFCIHEGVVSGLQAVLLFTALFLFVGGYAKGFYQRLKTKR